MAQGTNLLNLNNSSRKAAKIFYYKSIYIFFAFLARQLAIGVNLTHFGLGKHENR
jgi:hypothetical protein